MRGLPEPVGLSRALALPTLSQQAANACSPFSGQHGAKCKRFQVVRILTSEMRAGVTAEDLNRELMPHKKDLVIRKEQDAKPNVSADQGRILTGLLILYSTALFSWQKNVIHFMSLI